MPRRLALACLTLILTCLAESAPAQVPYGTNTIPARRALARINLDQQFVVVVPLVGAEKLTELSIQDGMMFAQTNHANFYTYDAETGRYLWGAHLGAVTTKAEPASVNKDAVFVSNSNQLFCLDRRTGRQLWKGELTAQPTSATGVDENRVMVGLENGKLVCFDAKTGLQKWNIQTNSRVSSHPILAGRVVAFGSEDRKVYMARADDAKLLWRFATGGKIIAPIGTHGVRTLLVASTDKAIYSVDLFNGSTNWTSPTGSPVEQEPLVADDEVFVVNTEGMLSSFDIPSGNLKWTVSTLGGRLLSVSPTKVYLESHDDDLFVVDRGTGKIVYDPSATFNRIGLNLREYVLGPTNRYDDRLYFATTHGLAICLRETGLIKPHLNHDPNAKPFGYIPPEGYPDTPAPLPSTTPAEGEAGAAAATDPK